MTRLPRSLGRRAPIPAVGLLYALAVFVLTMPGSLHPSHQIIGNNADVWIFYWDTWWLGRAIAEGRPWFFTPYLFHPLGADLLAHSHAFPFSAIALLIRPLLGPVAAYNLSLLFGLWIGAMGTFLLVHEIAGDRAAALLAGFLFTFAPYHITQALAHANLSAIHWWPFYALFLHRLLRRGRVTDLVGTGFFAALTLWASLHLALLLGVWTVVYLGWHLVRALRRRKRWDRLAWPALRLGLATLLALILSLPLLLPLLTSQARWDQTPVLVDETMTRQTDLLAYAIPPPYHPLLGKWTGPLYHRFETNQEGMPYLGYGAVVLALLALRRWRREAGGWLLTAGLGLVLAAGPVLRWNGTLYPRWPLPYRLLGEHFPFSALRVPDRFNLLVVFGLAVSAGLGVAGLSRRHRWRLIPLALLIVGEYWYAPLPTMELPPRSPFFAQMAQDPAWYGVVDYPMGYTASKRWLYYQTLHGKPIVEGHVSRYTAQNYAFIASQPLLRALYPAWDRPARLPDEMLAPSPDIPIALGPALRSLAEANVRYRLVHKPYTSPNLSARLQRLLPSIPSYEDGSLSVYELTHPRFLLDEGMPLPLSPTVSLLRLDLRPPTTEKPDWRLLALATLEAPSAAPLRCRLELLDGSGAVRDLGVSLTFFEELPPAEGSWRVGDLDVLTESFSLPPDLEAGRYRWALTCPDYRRVPLPGWLERPPDGPPLPLRRPTGITYGSAIRLRGYSWQAVGPSLRLTLLWEALEPPTDDYKVFIHLLDGTGALARQHDAMPCAGACPTSGWKAGDRIADQALLPLGGLPPGEYRLAVGLYHPTTLQRLPARDPAGQPYRDAYVVLPERLRITAFPVPDR